MPSARPYFPNSSKRKPGKTRVVDSAYYTEMLVHGCPHCKDPLHVTTNSQTGGQFAMCKNDYCPHKELDDDHRYYYVSEKNESLPFY